MCIRDRPSRSPASGMPWSTWETSPTVGSLARRSSSTRFPPIGDEGGRTCCAQPGSHGNIAASSKPLTRAADVSRGAGVELRAGLGSACAAASLSKGDSLICGGFGYPPVSYTHLRAHETVLDLV